MLRKNIELSLSIFAVIVSFVAVGFSWWQLEVARQHNRISVKPVIAFSQYLEGPGGRNGMFVSNQGLGPAKLKSLEVTVDGKVFSGLGQNRWPDVIRQAGSTPRCFKQGWPTKDAVLKAGEEKVLLAQSKAALPICDVATMFFYLDKDITIVIGYESFYGKVFEARSSTKMSVGFP